MTTNIKDDAASNLNVDYPFILPIRSVLSVSYSSTLSSTAEYSTHLFSYFSIGYGINSTPAAPPNKQTPACRDFLFADRHWTEPASTRGGAG